MPKYCIILVQVYLAVNLSAEIIIAIAFQIHFIN